MATATLAAPDASRSGRDPLGGTRLWLVAFLGFFLLGGAWAVAMPHNGVPDEINHMIRAAGAARGQLVGDTVGATKEHGETFVVPEGIQAGALCWQGDRRKPATCGLEPTGDRTPVRASSTASRYPPAFYLAVGTPLVLWPSWGGVIAARLIAAALSAAMLASAAYGAVRWTRNRLLPGAVLVATTPMTLHLAGSINPNGFEIAAGVALFAALVPLLLEPEPGSADRRGPLLLAGVAAVALAVTRPFGPLWLLIAVGILVVPTTRQRLRRVLGRRAGVGWTVAAAAAAASTLAWIGVMRTGEPGWVNLPPHMSFTQALRFEIIDRAGGYAEEMVGVMSWADTRLPAWSYLMWFMASGVLVLTALGVGGWTARWRLCALAAAVFGIPVLTDAANVNRYGFVAQGRYVLPIAVGLPIIAASVLGERGTLGRESASGVTRMLAAVVIPLHLVALWYTMIRWEYGIPDFPATMPLNPLRGAWLPPLGPVLPLVAAVLGAALLLRYAWATTRLPASPVPVPPVPDAVEPAAVVAARDDAAATPVPDPARG